MSDQKPSLAAESFVTILALLVIVFPWLAGIVYAHGFWSTACAILLPPYAWYLAVHHLLT